MILEIDDLHLNDPMRRSIAEAIKTARGGHMTDLHVRINGKWQVFQADWIKHLVVKP